MGGTRASALAFSILIAMAAGAAAQAMACNIVGSTQYGQCDQFIACILAEKNVTQGASAIFPITVSNAYGGYPISVSLSSVCDPANLECSFVDVPFPNIVPAGEYRNFDLYVYTTKTAPGNYSIPLRITASKPGYDCSEDATLDLRVWPNASAQAPEAVGVYSTLYPAQATARPGDTVKYFVTLRNTLDAKAYASIGAAGTNPFEDSTRYSYADVKLEAGETKVVEIDVTVPPGTPGMGAEWAFVVRTDGYDDTVLPVQLLVHGPQMTLVTTGEPVPGECLEAKYGEPLSVRMGVRNDGEIEGPYDFSLEGTEAAKKFAFVTPGKSEIAPGDRRFVNFTVAPRLETAFGTYYYSFIAKYGPYTAFRRDYCVRVKASENISVEKEDIYEIQRAATSTATFTLTNTGSATCNFSLDHPPVPGMTIVASPSMFRLTPKQSLDIDLAVGTTMATPLEDYYVPVTLRSSASSCNIDKDIDFALSVVSSNRSGESLLSIQKRDFATVEGVAKTYQISVSNKGSSTLKKTRIQVLGVPAEWANVGVPRDIPAGATRSFELTLRPASAGQRTYEVTLAAVSGRESVREESTMTVDPADKKINFEPVTIVPVQNNGATTETQMSLAVKNTGNVPVTNVEPLLFSSESDKLVLDTDAQGLSLEPGQTATIQIRVKPLANAQTSEQQVELKLGTAEGASSTQSIKLPAMLGSQVQPSTPLLPWKILGVIVLLILIFGILAKEELGKRTKA